MLKQRFAILRPMLLSKEVIDNFDNSSRAQGFLVLRSSLLLTCLQDIAKIAFDNSVKTPSIHGTHKALQDTGLVRTFRKLYSEQVTYDLEEERDESTRKALKELERRERKDREVDFDRLISEFNSEWPSIASSQSLLNIRSIRDKVTAHTELVFSENQYRPLDISDFGISINELERIMNTMQRLIEKINMIVRSADFAWDSFDWQITKASNEFWKSP